MKRANFIENILISNAAIMSIYIFRRDPSNKGIEKNTSKSIVLGIKSH